MLRIFGPLVPRASFDYGKALTSPISEALQSSEGSEDGRQDSGWCNAYLAVWGGDCNVTRRAACFSCGRAALDEGPILVVLSRVLADS